MYLEGVLEGKQNAEKDAGRNGVSVATVRYVRCDEIQWMDSETAAAMMTCDESESLNSWTSSRQKIQHSHPDAYRYGIDSSSGSYSSGCRPKCQPWSGLQLAIVTFEGYLTQNEFSKVPSKAPWRRIVKEGEQRSHLESPYHPLTPYYRPHRIRSKRDR